MTKWKRRYEGFETVDDDIDNSGLNEASVFHSPGQVIDHFESVVLARPVLAVTAMRTKIDVAAGDWQGEVEDAKKGRGGPHAVVQFQQPKSVVLSLQEETVTPAAVVPVESGASAVSAKVEVLTRTAPTPVAVPTRVEAPSDLDIIVAFKAATPETQLQLIEAYYPHRNKLSDRMGGFMYDVATGAIPATMQCRLRAIEFIPTLPGWVTVEGGCSYNMDVFSCNLPRRLETLQHIVLRSQGSDSEILPAIAAISVMTNPGHFSPHYYASFLNRIAQGKDFTEKVRIAAIKAMATNLVIAPKSIPVLELLTQGDQSLAITREAVVAIETIHQNGDAVLHQAMASLNAPSIS